MILGRAILLGASCLLIMTTCAEARRHGRGRGKKQRVLVEQNSTCTKKPLRFQAFLRDLGGDQAFWMKSNETIQFGSKKTCSTTYKMGTECSEAEFTFSAILPTTDSCIRFKPHDGNRRGGPVSFCGNGTGTPIEMTIEEIDTDFTISVASGKKGGDDTAFAVKVMCTKGKKPADKPCRCGVPVPKPEVSRIINGKEPTSEYPWLFQVELMLPDFPNPMPQAATLIGTKHILFASEVAMVTPDKISVKTFDGKIYTPMIDFSKKLPTPFGVVVELKQEIDFANPAEELRPICLPSTTDRSRYVMGNVTGWGMTDVDDETSYSDALMEARVKLVSDNMKSCKKLLQSLPGTDEERKEMYACAMPMRRRPTGACVGDIGAPVMARIPIKGAMKPQNLQLVGVVKNYGKYPQICGSTKQPALIVKGKYIAKVMGSAIAEFKTCSSAPVPEEEEVRR